MIRASRVEGALAEYRVGVDGPFDFARANRLASRAGFGGTVEEIQQLVELGLEGALEVLSRDPEEDVRSSTERYRPSDGVQEARAWWLDRMLSGGGALRERLALLWHGHFATSVLVVLDLGPMLRQNEILRWHGDGPFGRLLKRVALDAAMTTYLDGNQNRRGAPNENLAREVLELFALGHGNYTQDDIRELARALTGWSVELQDVRFDPGQHDDGVKSILGRTGRFGAESALDVVTEHPACAESVSAILWDAFVAPPRSPALRAELAAEFRADGLHVGRFVGRILRSRAFLAAEELPPRIPSPVELACTMARRLGLRPDCRKVAEHAGRMGQSLFAPPSVAGWPQDRGWLSTSWCLRRLELPFLLLSQASPHVPAGESPDAFVRHLFCADAAARAAVDAARRRTSGQPFERALACLLALPEVQRT